MYLSGYEVKVCNFPQGEDIMYGLSSSKIFQELDDAIKCATIWTQQFHLQDVKIFKIFKEEVAHV